jgi:hypothetical protein
VLSQVGLAVVEQEVVVGEGDFDHGSGLAQRFGTLVRASVVEVGLPRWDAEALGTVASALVVGGLGVVVQQEAVREGEDRPA